VLSLKNGEIISNPRFKTKTTTGAIYFLLSSDYLKILSTKI